VLLLPEFLPDLVEDDAGVFPFNDLQGIVRTPRPRPLLGSRGCSAGEGACQQLPGWGEVSPLSPGVGTFPELFLGFGEANGPKEICWSWRGSE